MGTARGRRNDVLFPEVLYTPCAGLAAAAGLGVNRVPGTAVLKQRDHAIATHLVNLAPGHLYGQKFNGIADA